MTPLPGTSWAQGGVRWGWVGWGWGVGGCRCWVFLPDRRAVLGATLTTGNSRPQTLSPVLQVALLCIVCIGVVDHQVACYTTEAYCLPDPHCVLKDC